MVQYIDKGVKNQGDKMKKEKALSTIETALIAVIVCVVAIGGFTAFNKLKTKLAGLSSTETTGTLAVNPENAEGGEEAGEDPGEKNGKISIDRCRKVHGVCEVFPCPDKEGGVCVDVRDIETVGVHALYKPVTLGPDTVMTGATLDECIAAVAGGGICYAQTGEVVQCPNADDGGHRAPIRVQTCTGGSQCSFLEMEQR